jgi:predicted 3-demethylubiquinone-9 3-methyltransferase (glyoxalase superfamily)
MKKITPLLWFDDKAEEAVSFYTWIFKHSKAMIIISSSWREPWNTGDLATPASPSLESALVA